MNININGKHNKEMTDLASRVSKEDATTIMSIMATKILNICKTSEVSSEICVGAVNEDGTVNEMILEIDIKVKNK